MITYSVVGEPGARLHLRTLPLPCIQFALV